MLNKEQKIIISDYISQLNAEYKTQLRRAKILNNNGTLKLSDGHKRIKEWFLKTILQNIHEISDNDYGRPELGTKVFRTYINQFNSCSGQETGYEFNAKEFGLCDVE